MRWSLFFKQNNGDWSFFHVAFMQKHQNTIKLS